MRFQRFQPEQTKPLRENKLKTLFHDTCKMNLPFEYIEISSRTHQGMDHLYQRINQVALNHSYMGEQIPESYLKIEQSILSMREDSFCKYHERVS